MALFNVKIQGVWALAGVCLNMVHWSNVRTQNCNRSKTRTQSQKFIVFSYECFLVMCLRVCVCPIKAVYLTYIGVVESWKQFRANLQSLVAIWYTQTPYQLSRNGLLDQFTQERMNRGDEGTEMYKEKGREINSAEEEQILQSEEECGSTYEDEWMTLSPPKPGVKRRICTR